MANPTISIILSMNNIEKDTQINIPAQQQQTSTPIPSERVDYTSSEKTNET